MTATHNKYLFIYKTNVRIDDINFGHHLCHSRMINLLHNARALFLKEHSLSESNCFGCGLTMLNLNIDYLSQCFFNDALEIGLNFNVEKAKFILTYNVFNKTSNRLAAKATTLMGFIDVQKGKLKKAPLEFINIVSSIHNNN